MMSKYIVYIISIVEVRSGRDCLKQAKRSPTGTPTLDRQTLLIVSIVTIVAVDAIAADRALATIGASWSTLISGTQF